MRERGGRVFVCVSERERDLERQTNCVCVRVCVRVRDV